MAAFAEELCDIRILDDDQWLMMQANRRADIDCRGSRHSSRRCPAVAQSLQIPLGRDPGILCCERGDKRSTRSAVEQQAQWVSVDGGGQDDFPGL